MKLRTLVLTAALLLIHSQSFASNADDLNAEVDELNTDSEAAAADNAEIKARMAKEKARAEKALRAAHQKNQAAVAKRQASADQLKQSDEEIAQLTAEKAKLKSEVERLDKEAGLSEQAAQGSRTQAEQLRTEIEALKLQRGEKAKAFIDQTTQHDKVAEEVKKLEAEKLQLETDLAKSGEQEKLAGENLAKVKTDEAAKKAKLEAYIAGLRERYQKAQQRLAEIEAEGVAAKTAVSKLEVTAKVAENEVITAEAQLTRAPTSEAVGPNDFTFKRACKVFEKPEKGAGVLAVKPSGAKVSKNGEGRTWISFPLGERTAYAAKACF